MDQAHTSKSRSRSFPSTQRELVGLALQRVRLALALGLGGPAKGANRAARRGIVR
jgi:hypothetical protein